MLYDKYMNLNALRMLLNYIKNDERETEGRSYGIQFVWNEIGQTRWNQMNLLTGSVYILFMYLTNEYLVKNIFFSRFNVIILL